VQRVAVIDYGMGNLRSVSKAIEHVARGTAEVLVTDDHEIILGADRVVFPGQGAARDCMAEIAAHGLVGAVRDALAAKPFLGICMGMQVLLDHSEEHDTRCLGLVRGQVRHFPRGASDPHTGLRLSIPQMGWNRVEIVRPHPLWAGIEDGTHFYFANSYYVDPEDPGVVAGRTEYAVSFASAIARDNLFAVQFHPEKSQRAGLAMLENFLGWDGSAG
jgi:glutamine amidotransferase